MVIGLGRVGSVEPQSSVRFSTNSRPTGDRARMSKISPK